MIAVLCMGLALANPSDPLPRTDEDRSVRAFQRLVGDGPSWGVGARRSGPVTAWIFPDGVVQHAELRQRGHLTEVRRFDGLGQPLTTTTYADDAPSEVIVHLPGAAPLAVQAWETRDLGGATLRWPTETGDARLDAEWVETDVDPTTPGFRDGLLAGCGCTLEHLEAAWVRDLSGVRLRVRLDAPDHPWTGEVWALSTGTHLLLLSALVPADPQAGPVGGPAALALGRAMAALVTLPEAP